MPNKIKPTERQKRAFNLKKADPDKTYKDVMIMSGYTPVSAEDPKHNLTETRGYQQLLNDYQQELKKQGLTPEFIAKKLSILVNSVDEDIQVKALDRIIEGNGLKLKQDVDSINNIQINYHGMSSEELQARLDSLLQEVKAIQG